jgi:hypothetical protein
VQISLTQWLPIAVLIIAGGVQAFTLRILKQRNLLSEFPVFFRYTILCIASYGIALIGLLPMVYNCWQYFYLYWVATAITMAFEFAVLYEILVNALKPYSALIDLGKMLFRWAAGFLVLAALLTAFATAGSGTSKIVASMELLQRTIRLMQCGLLLLFFALEKRLGLSWRTHSMGIALGLGVYAAVDLSTTYLIDKLPAMTDVFNVSANLVYLGAAIFWAVTLAKPEPARKNVLDSPSRLVFQRWNEVLLSTRFASSTASAYVGGIDSFLPNVEQTVDRVLARKIVQ